MEAIKGGAQGPRRGRGPYRKKETPVKYDPADDIANETPAPDIDDEPAPKAKKVEVEGAVCSVPMPKVIEVKRTPGVLGVVPGWVWRCSKFRWQPRDFGTENERLRERVIDSSVQDSSLCRFLEDPTTPMTYCVAGSPDDRQALYFAAYLVSEFQRRSHNAVVWHNLYGGFDNPVLKKYDDDSNIPDPGLLVLTNLSPQATNTKLDKTRDLLTRFAGIPRILVVAGEDPISFCAARLNVEVNAIAYFRGNTLKQRVEVI
ncbi:DNA exonuclease [Burkholderia phage BcepSauron]|uniref:DNA exonuclease n=2 Tax=Sarumanvirus TaxID=2843450 RepID=A0A482MKW7_9CAUD|nr:DNA polymerase [Burkholderia phage BcepSaruman]YP_009904689.1 DNA polymerase [Burkholderia phage BcepSauron]QBQ74691.1 DNA exonuclease [Burkholderia phage BcepSauron]QBX06723.1 hypothetical protein BcepSaruman_310 [Burkholderia phage BcepSaruman]